MQSFLKIRREKRIPLMMKTAKKATVTLDLGLTKMKNEKMLETRRTGSRLLREGRTMLREEIRREGNK